MVEILLKFALQVSFKDCISISFAVWNNAVRQSQFGSYESEPERILIISEEPNLSNS